MSTENIQSERTVNFRVNRVNDEIFSSLDAEAKRVLDIEANDTAEKVQIIRKPDSLVIPIFTDLHTPDTQTAFYKKLIYLLYRLNGEIKPDALISLGDNLSMLGREFNATDSRIAGVLSEIFNDAASTSDAPLYTVNGNHDGHGTDFFDPDFWYTITGGKYDRSHAVRDGNSAYYYTDDRKANARLIFLSLPCGSDVDSERPTPLWKFGEKQLEWLANAALNVADGTNVLLFCHVPTYYYFIGDKEATMKVWTGTREARAYLSALCGWIDDVKTAEEIINAFCAHKAFSQGDIHADFRRLTSAKLFGWICGHMHYDALLTPGDGIDVYKNELLCPQIVIKSTNPMNRETMAAAIDVMVFTPSENRLSFIRAGDGDDRYLSYNE